MSLLLDALKKAEKAKEQAQRRSDDERADNVGAATTSAGAPPATAHVRTRNELPEISQSLEISGEDIAGREKPKEKPPGLALELEKPEPPASSPPPGAPGTSAAAAGAASQAASRAAAQRVFEAKFKEPNPRLPFYITIGVLGAFGVGVAVYFWLQLRPAPSLVNANPQRPADERPVLAVAAPAAGAAAPVPASTPATSIPGLPPAAATPATQPPAAAAPVPGPGAARAAVPARAEARPPQARPAPRATEAVARPIRPRVPRVQPKVNPRVAAGYEAYQSGDLAAARASYEQALGEEPMNRDALLGIAAVEMKARHYDRAEAYYERLLQADPRDPNAQAGLLALRSQLIDPVVAESRVKTLLASDPHADVLYFTLGNEYALQARWGEARQAYARAFAADPENPDFAYNVAVSLDHLGEPGPALDYYRRALALAGKRAASFDARAARERAQQLSH